MPQTRRTPAQPALKLPKHMKLSADEVAVCARLIRVYRADHYWLRYFIGHLLHMDASSANELRISQAEDALKVMKGFENWQNWFNETTQTWGVLKDFPGLEWYPWDDRDQPRGSDLVIENSFNQKEQLEAELKELRALIESPRSSFRSQAAEYAQRLGKALDRMAEENRKIEDE